MLHYGFLNPITAFVLIVDLGFSVGKKASQRECAMLLCGSSLQHATTIDFLPQSIVLHQDIVPRSIWYSSSQISAHQADWFLLATSRGASTCTLTRLAEFRRAFGKPMDSGHAGRDMSTVLGRDCCRTLLIRVTPSPVPTFLLTYYAHMHNMARDSPMVWEIPGSSNPVSPFFAPAYPASPPLQNSSPTVPSSSRSNFVSGPNTCDPPIG